MRSIRNGFVTLLILAAMVGGAYEWWNLDWRWRPTVIAKNQAEIGKLLQGSGWVSPGLAGARLYMISYRDCDGCEAFAKAEFGKLNAAGVDTRVIMIARPDVNGVVKSTPAERSTVAELWFNRHWALYQKWMAAAPEDWTAAGIPPADGDVARSAVVEAGPYTIERLTPLFKDNGLDLGYPTLVWWSKDGTMNACACRDPRAYGPVVKDLLAQ